MPAAALPNLIKAVFETLTTIAASPAPASSIEPAVPPRRSVFPDYIICLEDGRKLKMLKRHLRTAFNMTPAQYRERWGLPKSYPMIAPAYARKRSSIAKSLGLGRKQAPISRSISLGRPTTSG